jgi:hypothetical protein
MTRLFWALAPATAQKKKQNNDFPVLTITKKPKTKRFGFFFTVHTLEHVFFILVLGVLNSMFYS